ncbi:class II myosin [Lecanora helva]
MSSIVIKVGSLVIKTLSKPIANRIKAQAREHERFRKVCVNVAQGIHRWDMRFRLGLLQDTAAIDKQIAKEAAEAKRPPTVKTEAQTKADEARDKESEKPKEKKKPKIRPLSEAKAIDLGANFVSETFLLAVGIALILFENARKGRQEATRREDVADQIEELQKMNRIQRKSLVELDKELMVLRAKSGTSPGHNHSVLPKQLRDLDEEDDRDSDTRGQGFFSYLQGLFRSRNTEVETPEPTKSSDVEVAKQTNETKSAPAVSMSALNKILPRSHPRDFDVNEVDRPAKTNTTNKSNATNENPKAGS